jgi:hypothetical protein
MFMGSFRSGGGASGEVRKAPPQLRDRLSARVEIAPVAGRSLELVQPRDLAPKLPEQPLDFLFLVSLRHRFAPHSCFQRLAGIFISYRK